MAKIVTDNVLIAISKVVREDAPEASVLTEAQRSEIEALVTELIGDGFVVEILS